MDLTNSIGACFGGWFDLGPKGQAAHLLSIFVKMVAHDGVPIEQAHREFMQIAEYRNWVEREVGPFAEIAVMDFADRQDDGGV